MNHNEKSPWTVSHFIPEDGVYPTHEHEGDRLYGCYELEEVCDEIKDLTHDGEVEEAYRYAEENRAMIAAAWPMRKALECFERAWEELADEPKRGGRQPGEVLYEAGFFEKMRAALALARGEVQS